MEERGKAKCICGKTVIVWTFPAKIYGEAGDMAECPSCGLVYDADVVRKRKDYSALIA